ncbi:lipopolysaccharide heptosyltransferase family protein [bacterium]|nr:MAG: lipopolysaccharide heptosyltransferase family protein [bacterium]
MRMVLVRNDKLGDSLLTTPLVATLHREIVDLDLTVVTDRVGKEVFRRLPQVGQVRLMPPFPSFREALQEGLAWRRGGVQSVIMTRPNGRVYALAALLSGAKHRIGAVEPSKWYARLFTANRWSTFDSREHFARKYLSLAEPLLGRHPADEPTIFPYREVSLNPVAAILHMGGGGAHVTLMEETYKEVAAGLKEAFGSVALTGDEGMVEMASRIGASTGALDLTGKTDLDALAGLQQRARVTVGATTGAMHLAAAVGCPQVVAFLMRSADPQQWSPWMSPHRIVRSDHFCAVCTESRCTRTEWTCRNTLRPEALIDAAQDVARPLPK